MMEVLFLKLEDYKRACIVLLSKTGRFILLTERIKIFYLLEASCKRVYRVFQSNKKVFHQASIKKFPLFPFFDSVFLCHERLRVGELARESRDSQNEFCSPLAAPSVLRDFTNPLNLVNLWSLSTPEFLYSLATKNFCSLTTSS